MVRHTLFEKIASAPGCLLELDRSQQDHLFKVFRAGIGDEVELLDGAGKRGIAVVEPGKRLLLKSVEEIPEPEKKYHLYCAVAKRSKFEPLLKQAAELGVWSITPVRFTRSVSDADKSSGRWQILLQEGCKQSKNPFLPKIREPISLEKALEELTGYNSFYGGINESTMDCTSDPRDGAFLVGPEGGFTPEELEKIKRSGIKTLNLGPYVLRLETAAICGMAVLRKMLPLLLLLFLLLLTGCEKNISKHPLYLRGSQLRAEGNYPLALEYYLNCYRKYPNSPEVLLAIAQMYDEHLDNIPGALYFYSEYLKAAPPGMGEEAERSISLLRSRWERSIEDGSKVIRDLRQENALLRGQVSALKRLIQERFMAAEKAKHKNKKTK